MILVQHAARGGAGRVRDSVLYVTREGQIEGDVIVRRGVEGELLGEDLVRSVEARSLEVGEGGEKRFWTRRILVDQESLVERTEDTVSVVRGASSISEATLAMEYLSTKTKAQGEGILHFSISWRGDDEKSGKVRDDEAFAAVDAVLAEWGLNRNHVAVISIHRNTDNVHAHCVVQRAIEVEPGGRVLAIDPNKEYGYARRVGDDWVTCREHDEGAVFKAIGKHPGGMSFDRAARVLRTLEMKHNERERALEVEARERGETYEPRIWAHDQGAWIVDDAGEIVRNPKGQVERERTNAAYERSAGKVRGMSATEAEERRELCGLAASARKLGLKTSFKTWARDGDGKQSFIRDLDEAMKNKSRRSWTEVHSIAARWGIAVEDAHDGTGLRFVDRDGLGGGAMSFFGNAFGRTNMEKYLGNFAADAPTVGRTYATSGATTFEQYVSDERFGFAREAKAILVGGKAVSASALESTAARYGLKFEKAGGGYVVRDSAEPATERSVKITDLGNCARGLGKRLDRAMEPREPIGVEAFEGHVVRESYAEFLAAREGALRYEAGERIAKDARDFVRDIFETSATLSADEIASHVEARTFNEQQMAEVMARLDELATDGTMVHVRETRTEPDDRGRERPKDRWTTQDNLERERALLGTLDVLAARQGERAEKASTTAEERVRMERLDDGQRAFVERLLDGETVVFAQGKAGAGKTSALRVAREVMEPQGWRFVGATPTGRQAANLREAGIQTRTIAGLIYDIKNGKMRLGPRDIVVIDEAGMVGTKDGGKLLAEVARSGARLTAVGDDRQMGSVSAGNVFREMHRRFVTTDFETVYRQETPWLLEACEAARNKETIEKSVDAFDKQGRLFVEASPAAAHGKLVDLWHDDAERYGSRVMIAIRNADVEAINEAATAKMLEVGALGERRLVMTEKGEREFFVGQRVVFAKNESQAMHVTNGSFGTISKFESAGVVLVSTDDNRVVRVNTKEWAHLDVAYCVNVFKTQSISVDASYLYASRADYANSFYVGTSRARKDCYVVGDESELTFHTKSGKPLTDHVQNLKLLLNASRAKDMALDYDVDGERGVKVSEKVTREPQAAARTPDMTDVGTAKIAAAREDLKRERAAEDSLVVAVSARRAESARAVREVLRREATASTAGRVGDEDMTARRTGSPWLGMTIEDDGRKALFRFDDGRAAFAWDGTKVTGARTKAGMEAAIQFVSARCGGVTIGGADPVAKSYALRIAVEQGVTVRNPEMQSAYSTLRAHKQASEREYTSRMERESDAAWERQARRETAQAREREQGHEIDFGPH